MEDENALLRLFIGIRISPEIRDAIGDLQGELEQFLEGVRWVPPENLHVTLKFLGNCPAEMVEDIGGVLMESIGYLPYWVEVGGLGGFPSSGSARIIWVGVDDSEGTLGEIYISCERGCRKLGFDKEKRKYHPHITIGRCRKRPAKLPWSGFREGDRRYPLTIDRITLFESQLERTGAKYFVVDEVKV